MFKIARVQASDTDSRRLDKVDVALIGKPITLLAIQAQEREHADLFQDMLPRPRSLVLVHQQIV